jgi:periplasmic divalent cation tolerance protein
VSSIVHSTDVVIVLTTVADGAGGEALARALVDERLAACVNVHGSMVSVYRWKGKVECDPERQLVIKTTRGCLPALEARVKALHSYELPELLVLPVESGSAAYLDWVECETAQRGVS